MSSPGDPYRFDINIQGKLEFAQKALLHPVIFEVVNGHLRNPGNFTQLGLLFTEPYFYVKDGKATAVDGISVEDLFILKKEGILNARGLF